MKSLNHLAVTVTAALTLSVCSANASEYQPAAESPDATISVMKPASWFENMPNSGMTMDFNPAHPAGWAVIMNPRTHSDWHMAFTNPSTYAQFMKPQFYMQFMNPTNWVAWLNPANYATFIDPNTWVYWMTPHAYLHALNPDNYTQAFSAENYSDFLSLETFASWLKPESYSIFVAPKGTVSGGAGVNYFKALLGDSEAVAQIENMTASDQHASHQAN